MVRNLIAFHLGVLAVILCLAPTPIATAETTLNIASPPSKAEWQHFNKMTPGQLAKLWQYQVARGKTTLGQWAWQWRLGWIRQCAALSMPKVCPEILRQGLIDEAMVVRAETASTVGMLYRGKPNKAVIDGLAKSFLDPRNVRRGSPLYVCDRVLSALNQIGGPDARAAAIKLARRYPSTAEYWSKVDRQNP